MQGAPLEMQNTLYLCCEMLECRSYGLYINTFLGLVLAAVSWKLSTQAFEPFVTLFLLVCLYYKFVHTQHANKDTLSDMHSE